jgi:hypothetical protein
MAGVVTLTGTTGAANTMTAKAFTGVNKVEIDMNANMVTMFTSEGTVSPVSVAAATTVTATKSGSNWTLTIS